MADGWAVGRREWECTLSRRSQDREHPSLESMGSADS